MPPPTHAVRLDTARRLLREGRGTEAQIEVQAALAQAPRDPHALALLGRILKRHQRLRAAASALTLALKIDPTLRAARLDLAQVHTDLGENAAALETAREAVRLAPDDPQARSVLGQILSKFGRIHEAVDELQQAVALTPDSAELHSALIFLQHLDPRFTPGELLAETLRWRHRHADPLRPAPRPFANDRDLERPLRVGYVSPDFCRHASNFFVLPLLAHHDPDRVHVTAYASVQQPDATTDRFRSLVPRWRDIAGLNDSEVAAQIREDRIDVLVDLGMHVARTRLLVFARKPAPVQVAWMGLPATTGLDAIDYLFTDPHLEPPPASGPWSAEKSLPLPDAWCCYDPDVPEIPVGDLPAATAGHVTFGSLNRFNKINPAVLGLWARALAAIPASRLLLRCPPGPARRDALRILAARGVADSRIEFARVAPRLEYLGLHRRIDIALDPFPYNGHTTTCDALWMGVPVLTLAGPTLGGRMGRSLLTTAGLADWIAYSPEQFVRLAADFAADLTALASLRASLRPRLQASPLMDAPRFARSVESACRTAWRRWCATA